jgi:predicted DCC family thiol-disulfide oxidoreductase YuxK
MSTPIGPDELVVFFDASCSLCRSIQELCRALDWRGRIAWRPLQTPGLAAALGLAPETLASTIHVLSTEGQLFTGAEAVAAVLDAIAVVASPFSWVYRQSGLADVLERWFEAVSGARVCPGGCELPPGPVPPLCAHEARVLSARLKHPTARAECSGRTAAVKSNPARSTSPRERAAGSLRTGAPERTGRVR